MSRPGRRQRRFALVATAALAIAGLFSAAAEGAPPPGQVTFSAATLFPKFGPNIEDYVVRCNNGPVTVQGHTSGGWEAAIGQHPFRRGDFSEVVPLSSGRPFAIKVRDAGHTQLYRYYVRCLPNDFPTYTFIRYEQPVFPRYFTVFPGGSRYAIIFDRHGVPVWWYHGQAFATRVLPSGKFLWWNRAGGWGTHRLNGSLIRALYGVGVRADHHDLQLLGNGNHMLGAYVQQRHVDTRPYGSSDATVVNAELQQVSPGGKLIWDWKSQDHISLAETGRWWPRVRQREGYDLAHWNSVEPIGGSVIASFKTLDAVIKIDKSTGRIVWKLGGTTTPRSLEVLQDPRQYTFGGQHDARLLPDGTLTVFDNRSLLGGEAGQPPRAVRYRINEQAGTATLLESISDPVVPESICCGSARRVANGHWLIDWGYSKVIGGYAPGGERTFRLVFKPARMFSYRAEPVPVGVLSPQDLRQAMNAMYGGI